MTFNDEGLARAVAACPVPVVTGIGHEPDNSICDMVSDRRCSTPTAAAESVAPEFSELVSALDGREQRLQRVLEGKIVRAASACDGLGGRLGRAMDVRLERECRSLDAFATRPCLTSPANIVDRREVELAQTVDRFCTACERAQGRFAMELDRLAPRLRSSAAHVDRMGHGLELAASRLRSKGAQLLNAPAAELGRSAAALDALSPLKVLGRGYSIAYDGGGSVATRADSFQAGDALRLRMADGDVLATVDAVECAAAPRE